ncbi:MAG: hypothetical protein EU529_00230 [Promethearchaeota archaeon]|nr:MAG: hypothetical protein EU529_00230 [Candidatus Lokiarchaeota archaeon]
MSSNGFYEDLSNIVKETAKDCKIYKDRCNEVEYDFNTILNESNLGEIPYIPWVYFKKSNDKFKELLRGNTFEKLDFWLESSSTSGDPSVVGRLESDLEVLKTNYNDVFNSFSIKDKINNLILFAPKLYMINSIRHKFYEKNAYLLYKAVVDIWEGKHVSFLLQFFLGHTLKNFFKTGKMRAAIGISGKDLKKELNRVEKNKIPTIMANSPIWMHRVLSDYYEKEKRTFDMSGHFNIITGGGGWDGTKGRVIIGYQVEKPEFIEKMCDMFNITPDKFCDNFAATESPLACGGHWSKKYNDFILHVDKNKGRIVIRDKDTLESIRKTGETGILELITPYGVDNYAGVAVLLDDLAQVENWDKCPECGREGAIFRIMGRLTPSIGKGCSSLFNSSAFKL